MAAPDGQHCFMHGTGPKIKMHSPYGRGHYDWIFSLDKRAYFGILTWKQMLIQAKKD